MVSDPEPDELFRARLLRVVEDADRHVAQVGVGAQLDRLGRKYDVYRTSVPLKGFDGFEDGGTKDDDV